MAFIFSGIVWAQLTRRAHSIRIAQSVGHEAAGLTGAREETDSAELEDEFHDISSFGNVDYSKRKGRVARRGVGRFSAQIKIGVRESMKGLEGIGSQQQCCSTLSAGISF